MSMSQHKGKRIRAYIDDALEQQPLVHVQVSFDRCQPAYVYLTTLAGVHVRSDVRYGEITHWAHVTRGNVTIVAASNPKRVESIGI